MPPYAIPLGARPKYAIPPGARPKLGAQPVDEPVLNEQGVTAEERALLNTVAPNPESAVAWLRQRGYEAKLHEGEPAVRKGPGPWRRVEPLGFMRGGFMELLKDLGPDAVDEYLSAAAMTKGAALMGGSSAAAGMPTGPGAILTGIAGATAGAGAGAAAAEAARRTAGYAAGFRETPKEALSGVGTQAIWGMGGQLALSGVGAGLRYGAPKALALLKRPAIVRKVQMRLSKAKLEEHGAATQVKKAKLAMEPLQGQVRAAEQAVREARVAGAPIKAGQQATLEAQAAARAPLEQAAREARKATNLATILKEAEEVRHGRFMQPTEELLAAAQARKAFAGYRLKEEAQAARLLAREEAEQAGRVAAEKIARGEKIADEILGPEGLVKLKQTTTTKRKVGGKRPRIRPEIGDPAWGFTAKMLEDNPEFRHALNAGMGEFFVPMLRGVSGEKGVVSKMGSWAMKNRDDRIADMVHFYGPQKTLETMENTGQILAKLLLGSGIREGTDAATLAKLAEAAKGYVTRESMETIKTVIQKTFKKAAVPPELGAAKEAFEEAAIEAARFMARKKAGTTGLFGRAGRLQEVRLAAREAKNVERLKRHELGELPLPARVIARTGEEEAALGRLAAAVAKRGGSPEQAALRAAEATLKKKQLPPRSYERILRRIALKSGKPGAYYAPDKMGMAGLFRRFGIPFFPGALELAGSIGRFAGRKLQRGLRGFVPHPMRVPSGAAATNKKEALRRVLRALRQRTVPALKAPLRAGVAGQKD